MNGFCWCYMCGYNATLTESQMADFRREMEVECPDCDAEHLVSILEFGDQLPETIAPDDPILAYGE